MDRRNIVISLQYTILKLKKLSWNDILVMLNIKYFEREAVIEYAKTVFGNISDYKKINVDELDDTSIDRLMFVVLSWLYERKDQFDPLSIIWRIFEDFDYPSVSVIFYDCYSVEDGVGVGIEGIYQRWEKYLREYEQSGDFEDPRDNITWVAASNADIAAFFQKHREYEQAPPEEAHDEDE